MDAVMTGLSRAFLRTFFLGLALWATIPGARAVLPDPVAFGVAMEVGDMDKARQWLDEGLPPNFLADRIGSGLMIAAWEGNIPLMELFVQRGANINFVNRNGEQALQLAAWKGQTEAVKWLLARGAAINRKGKEWSALHYAVFAGHEDLAKMLLGQGANVNAQAPNGSTVLMMAAREGHEKLAQTLIEAGADTGIRNENGESALTWAMRHNNLKIAKMVASPEAFALAVKAPPQSFGVAIRSVPPPNRISEILRQINRAEATGQPTTELRQALFDAVAEFKREASPTTRTTMPRPNVIYPKMPKQPQALVITADRQGGGGERAEMVYGGNKAATGAGAGANSKDPAELLRQLKAAEAAGQPTTALRRAFFEAVQHYRGAE
jgi:hypothetical protein